MALDTGKAKVSYYDIENNIMMIDIYADDEMHISDVNGIITAIRTLAELLPVDVILVKSGRYRLAPESADFIFENSGIVNKVVYVIKHMSDIHVPVNAMNTYLKDHFVDFCSSVDDAYHTLRNTKKKPE